MKYAYLTTALLIFSPLAASQTCKDSITASTPDSRFTVNGQEVTDTETGLIWQKCPRGKTGSDCSAGAIKSLNWSAALKAAETEAQQTGKAWRLPNIKELRSIVEEKCVNPAINLTIFPNINSSTFWSASPAAYHSDRAWHVDFSSGNSNGSSKSNSLHVRLVRKGQ